MHRFRLFILFFGPSINSGLITGLLAVILLAAANYSYVVGSSLLYDFLFGKGTPYDLIQSSRDTAGVINQTVLGNPLLNKVLFFGFWVMVGLFVYAIISVLSQSVAETEDEFEQMHYIHARKAQIEQDIILRLTLRASGILAAFIYGWVFIRIIFPFCIYISRIGLSNLSHPNGVLNLLFCLFIMLLALHIVVLISRLIVLRPRVFGEWDSLG